MKTFLKIFIGLLFVIIIALSAFIYTFDANDYKDELTELTEVILDRAVNIQGDIDISVYPWIGVKVNNVTVGNPDGFSKKTFATVEQFDVKIKIIPLLQKRLDVEGLVLHRLAVDLEKNASGKNNWSNLSDSQEGDGIESKLGLSGLVIGGIELTNSKLSWSDTNTGKQFKVSTLNLETEAVVRGQPLPLNLSAYIESNHPAWQASVNVKTRLEFNSDSLLFNANDLKLVVKALLPGTAIEKLSLAMVANSEIDVQAQTVKLNNAKVSVLGMVMSGEFDIENIFSIPVIQGPMKIRAFEAQKLAKHLKIEIPVMANAQSLKNISMESLFKTDFNSIYLDDISAKVDDSYVQGFVHVTGMKKPVVRYDLKVDQIKLHDYRSVDSGSVQDGLPLPLDVLRATDLEGVFGVENVSIDDIELTNFYARSEIKKGILEVSPITVQVGDSKVKATMQLDVRAKPVGVFAAKVMNVDASSSINPVLKNILGDDRLTLEGIVNADISLKTRGESVSAMTKATRGTVKIKMAKTVVQGVDPEHATRSVTAAYANKHNFRTSQSFVPQYEAGKRLEFENLNASFKVSGSKWSNNDLSLVSDKVNITGSGSIDFGKGNINYRPVIDMHVSNRVDIRDKLRDHPMEYHAHGEFENIKCEFDIEKYELLVGRLLVQEGKARKIRQKKNKSKNAWDNVRSK